MFNFVVPYLMGKSQDHEEQQTLKDDLRIFSDSSISSVGGLSIHWCSGALLQQQQLRIKT